MNESENNLLCAQTSKSDPMLQRQRPQAFKDLRISIENEKP